MFKKSLIVPLMLVAILSSCKLEPKNEAELVSGYKPVYIQESNFYELIKSEAPLNMQNEGKIYIKDNYLFVNEISKGVHVFDNSNPNSPKSIAFINIPGNVDISIKDNFMYADCYSGLAIIDITDVNNATLLNFEPSILGEINNTAPPAELLNVTSGRLYFECYDPSLGDVIGWEKTAVNKFEACFIER